MSACLVGSDSLRPHRLYPTRLLHPRDSPGKNTGVGCHFLLQGTFPTQGSNPSLLCLPHCRWILYHRATRKTPAHVTGSLNTVIRNRSPLLCSRTRKEFCNIFLCKITFVVALWFSACYNHLYNHQSIYLSINLFQVSETGEPKSQTGPCLQTRAPPAHSRMSWG